MPDTKSDGETPEPEGSGGPKKMIMTAVLAVVLVGLGYFLGGMMGGGGSAAVADGSGESAESASETAAEVEKPHVGYVIDLDAVNVNLADGHYLRVAISLGLSEDMEFGHGTSPDDFPTAAAAHVVLDTFSGQTIDDLATADGREHALHEIEEALVPHYGEDVVHVYFTEFVMQ